MHNGMIQINDQILNGEGFKPFIDQNDWAKLISKMETHAQYEKTRQKTIKKRAESKFKRQRNLAIKKGIITKKIQVCDCIYYNVECEINDSIDIACGGSRTLGYFFYVSAKHEPSEIIDFIKLCLEKYNQPLLNIKYGMAENINVKRLWDKNKIEACIKKGY